ncbi:hypothetical protein [Cupriavidus sp.]|uniref:hypothetical protein n=1 Tax=Cupriavidus sp. TaxID=1873897 RepID=UPI003D126EFD
MTLPAVPPLSLSDVAAELRAGAGIDMAYEAVKRLAGVSRLATSVSLSQLLGKTRPYWGGVDAGVNGNYIGYSNASFTGALSPQIDQYFGNVQIRQLMTSTYDSTVETSLVFASDPGFRNAIKARLLDNDFVLIREITLTYFTGGSVWSSPSRPVGSAADATLFTGPGSYQLDLIKL